jgi:hypothetical protein
MSSDLVGKSRNEVRGNQRGEGDGQEEKRKELGQIENTESASSHWQRVVEQESEKELGAKKGFDLAGSDLGERGKAEVAFPGFEEDFDAPAQTVEAGRLLGGEDILKRRW